MNLKVIVFIVQYVQVIIHYYSYYTYKLLSIIHCTSVQSSGEDESKALAANSIHGCLCIADNAVRVTAAIIAPLFLLYFLGC